MGRDVFTAMLGSMRPLARKPISISAVCLVAALTSVSLSCGGGGGEEDAGRDASVDAALDAGPPPPAWPSRLPATTSLGERRGRAIARSIVHVHSPLSHDACDGTGWVDGALADEACLARFRAALCALRIDTAMVTDHVPHLDEVGFEGALWIAEGDERVENAAGEVIASRMACPDGHRVLLTVGSENALMPLGLERHPGAPGDLEGMRAIYEGSDPASIAALRETGALIWQAHTEERPLEDLRARDLDGLEIYNLHANVDPGIREEHLGLDPAGFLPALLDFTRPAFRLPPDLALLAFVEPNRPALDRWDTLLSEGLRVSGSGGCDAHENVFPMELADGERADSYRRMMYWIQNHLLVDGDSPEDAKAALASGRFYVTSEIFGPPVGFDFVAEGGAEMGETASVGDTLRVVAPALPEGWPQDPPPVVTLRLFHARAGGGVEVATSDGATLEHVATEPGAYRVEVWMAPEHARPFLGARADRLLRDVVWVYSNPIFVE